ncbi:aspartyl protease family protein [Silvibacterium sp.]|uniref:aspartyl protease family protein n=1 Tax=Silvibacterium sp. TaxID=1964179 RepID=UPI0039E64F11
MVRSGLHAMLRALVCSLILGGFGRQAYSQCDQQLVTPNAPAPIRIPFRFEHKLMVVEATVNGQAGQFIVDTGFTGLAVDQTFAKKVSLPLQQGEMKLSALTSTTKAPAIFAPGAVIALSGMGSSGLSLSSGMPIVFDLSWITKASGMAVDSIIGSSLFVGRVVTIDYRTNTLEVACGHVSPEKDGEVAFDKKKLPLVSATIAKDGHSAKGIFEIDTGGDGGIEVNHWFVERHANLFGASPDEISAKASDEIGIDGRQTYTSSVLSEFTLGGQSFRDVPAAIAADAKGASGPRPGRNPGE